VEGDGEEEGDGDGEEEGDGDGEEEGDGEDGGDGEEEGDGEDEDEEYGDEEGTEDENERESDDDAGEALNKIDKYLPKTIEAMKCEELKKILKEHHLSTSGNKVELVKRAIDQFCPSNNNRKLNAKLFKEMTTSDRSDDGIHFEHYKKLFNAQDLANRMWYHIEKRASVRHKHWTAVGFWGLIRVLIGNGWANHSEKGSGISLVEYRQAWAEKVLSGIPKPPPTSKNSSENHWKKKEGNQELRTLEKTKKRLIHHCKY
jgi:hypothetical protein